MKGAAAVIESRKEEIIEIWVQRVREELSTPKETPDFVLRDHLPLLMDDIIIIMKRYEQFEFNAERSNFYDLLDNSIGHGRHRSSSSGYDVEQVLKEYIILHKIMTAQLRAHKVFSTEIADLLKYIIENSMLYAVVAFNDSLKEIRQKLLSILAHDIRNPASIAYSSIGMLQQEDSPERFDKIKVMSKNSIRRAINLLEDLLETVTVEAGEGMVLHFSQEDLLQDINSVYGEASEIFSNEVILHCEAEEIIGVFDSAMLRRVLENIINNAVKYGGKDTPVTISVQNDEEKVGISVHNYGNPIPEEEQKEIFKFRTTTGEEREPGNLKSWGMGLSLVDAVANAHGGALHLKSNEKDGTTFKLILGKYANKPGKVKTSVQFAAGNSTSDLL